MLCVQAMRFGGPEVLVVTEALDPVAGPGQVVINVLAADTLHVDTVIRRGAYPFPIVKPPYVPGGGVAGEIVSVGAGVSRDLLGRLGVARTGMGTSRLDVETVAQLAQRDTHTGGYAEQAVVPADALVRIPVGLNPMEAAALANDGMTAMLLFESVRISSGEWVFITPAGGGLGNLLVQLSHAAGARVIGAARGARKLQSAKANGADVVIDYEQEDWVDRVRTLTGGRGVDVVLDGVGGDIGRRSLDVTARNGRFIGYGGPSGEFVLVDPADAHQREIQATSLFDLKVSKGHDLRLTELALTEAAAGRIKPLIGKTLPLASAADAHAMIEARAVVGKTLLLT